MAKTWTFNPEPTWTSENQESHAFKRKGGKLFELQVRMKIVNGRIGIPVITWWLVFEVSNFKCFKHVLFFNPRCGKMLEGGKYEDSMEPYTAQFKKTICNM